MTVKQRHRFTVAYNPETTELLTGLEKLTGFSPAQVTQKIALSHVGELWDYLKWLQRLPKDDSMKSKFGPLLLHSIGAGSLTEAIKKLDPTFVSTV